MGAVTGYLAVQGIGSRCEGSEAGSDGCEATARAGLAPPCEATRSTGARMGSVGTTLRDGS